MEDDPRTACDDACFRASLALDGALVDDVGLRRLRSHLDACPACARLVARMGLADPLERSGTPQPVRFDIPRGRHTHLAAGVRGLPWATATVAVAALALSGVSPTGGGAPDRLDQVLSANGAYPRPVVPFRLPIGQRSAADDFMGRSGTSSAAGDGADGADRDERIQ